MDRSGVYQVSEKYSKSFSKKIKHKKQQEIWVWDQKERLVDSEGAARYVTSRITGLLFGSFIKPNNLHIYYNAL